MKTKPFVGSKNIITIKRTDVVLQSFTDSRTCVKYQKKISGNVSKTCLVNK